MQPQCPERRLHPLGALFGIELGARTAREHLDPSPAAARAPLYYVLQLAEAAHSSER